MQWNLITNNNNLPEPGEQVLGLWLGGFWKKIIYSPDEGWYTARDGVEPVPPTWWAHVDSRPPKVSEVGEVVPVGGEGPLGPDASVLEYVREFLEKLIEVRDHTANGTMPAEIVGEYECYDDWAADTAMPLLQTISLASGTEKLAQFKREDVTKFSLVERLRESTEKAKQSPAGPPLALDVSLEKARALHRVWRALNDGDCPRCHKFHAANEIIRWPGRIACPACSFSILTSEIEKIEQMFAPAMDAAVAIFHAWRDEINNKPEKTDEVDRDK